MDFKIGDTIQIKDPIFTGKPAFIVGVKDKRKRNNFLQRHDSCLLLTRDETQISRTDIVQFESHFFHIKYMKRIQITPGKLVLTERIKKDEA